VEEPQGLLQQARISRRARAGHKHCRVARVMDTFPARGAKTVTSFLVLDSGIGSITQQLPVSNQGSLWKCCLTFPVGRLTFFAVIWYL